MNNSIQSLGLDLRDSMEADLKKEHDSAFEDTASADASGLADYASYATLAERSAALFQAAGTRSCVR